MQIEFIHVPRLLISSRLVQVYDKVHRTINALEYFTTNEWTFRNENQLLLSEQMNAIDRKKFCCDIRQVSWPEYMEIYILGVRQYLLKENPKTLPEARKRLNR